MSVGNVHEYVDNGAITNAVSKANNRSQFPIRVAPLSVRVRASGASALRQPKARRPSTHHRHDIYVKLNGKNAFASESNRCK